MNQQTADFKQQFDCLISAMPKDMQILVEGQLNTILNHYQSAAVKALSELYYAIPGQTNDQDWWSDELREAMENAKELV